MTKTSKFIFILLWVLLCLLPVRLAAQTRGGCVSFAGKTPSASGCVRAHDAAAVVTLLRAPDAANHKRHVKPEQFEPMLFDAAFIDGATFAGGATRFRFNPAAGEYVLEVILTDTDSDQNLFWLAHAGARLGPWRPVNEDMLSLTARVTVNHAPLEFTIETGAQRYVLAGVRWMEAREFEQRTVPRLLERARHWFTHRIYGRDIDNAFERASHLVELLERARLSRQPAVRAEATAGLARVRYWMATENGEADDLVRTGKLLSEAARLAPRDALLRQTLAAWCSGTPNFDMRAPTEEDFCRSIKPVRWQVNDKPLANAPEWAATQRALMARLNAITRWWVRERQLPNGELGGGWSDDVELLRFWGPLALGFGDADATRGIERLADGVWRSPFIENGYNKRIRDVEHAAEPTTDTLPLAVALDPHNQALRARLAQTTACLKHWIARAPDGYWRFRGAWFNCTEFDEHPNRALDVMLNTRAVGPALWQAYLTREPQLIETLARWGEAWTMSMRQTAAGKPAGVFPPAVQFADGNYLVRSSRWWLPDAEWHYFNWSGKNQACVAALLLALHDLTGERRWLDAAGESFAPVLSDSREPKLADELRRYPQAFLEWRRRSGDTRYDQAYQYAPPEADEAKRLTRLRAEMTREARATTQLHAFNFAMYTSEAIFTDRVYYALPLNYQQHLFGGETPRGDRLPMFAVTWPTTQADFARAVVDATNERADLLLYGFAAAEQSIRVRLWKLSPARYRWSLHPVNDRTRTLRAGAFEHRGRAQAHTFTLPARQEVILSISKEVR